MPDGWQADEPHAVIHRYQIAPRSIPQVMREVQGYFLPTFRVEPGIRDFYALDVGGDVLVTISVFENRASAEAAIKIMAEDQWLPNPPETVVIGRVA